MGEIIVIGKFDGGNPQCSSGIVKIDENTFRIYPYSEDGDDNFMFRVDVKVCSSYSVTKTVTLIFEWRVWKAERYMEDRSWFFYKQGDGEWVVQQAKIQDNLSILTLAVPPGENILSMNPLYNYDALQQYIRSISKNPFVESKIAGFSQENRNIWCVKITDKKVPDEQKTRVLIISRVHTHETAASYLTESMINYLLSEQLEVKKMLTNFIFYAMPMPNPDGVYNGLCKLTSVNGFDFRESNVATHNDKACRTFVSLVQETKPQFVLYVGSFMGNDFDMLGSNNEKLIDAFTKFMPDQTEMGRHWKTLFHSYKAPKEPPEKRSKYDFVFYCVEEIGAIVVLIGFAWYKRSFKDMNQIGVKAIKAFTAAIKEFQNKG